ncbi:MAG TPA: Gfo/Idh/MocA family oxidoreductase, partial [Planctomycetota bacterium]|nr:Gfo/Idh/MocA family oxidoreductase [Planctomycetota bacterium]
MPHSRRMFLGALMAGGALSSARRLPAEAVQPAGKSYRACVIGHTGRGGYGHGLDVCFQKIPGVTVAAVADPDEKGRAKAIQVTGAGRSYADWREMLEREKPDLVSIGMRWVENRLALVKSAVEAGAHVFMEKPMAASLEEADAILAAARE